MNEKVKKGKKEREREIPWRMESGHGRGEGVGEYK